MNSPRKLIVGYDLCEDMTQISCYSYKTNEPIPISTGEGEECCPIPTVLCVKKETKQWLFGEEAVACAADGSGVLVDHLLDKVKTGEETELLGMKLTPVALLEKYLRKTLTLIKNYFPTEPITRLVVTVRNTEPALVDGIYEALDLLGLEKDRATVISHAGVYLYYALSQDKSLWMNDVGLFDFNEEGLHYYKIHMNRRTVPMVAGLEKTDFTDTLNFGKLKQIIYSQRKAISAALPAGGSLDEQNSSGGNISYLFENIANKALYKQIITTLYFTGSGFEGDWADDIIKSLCPGRRVFKGQNLYTKGACYAAKELSGDRNLEDFVLLGDDMITSSVAVRVYTDAAMKDMPLTQAGVNWFEIRSSMEVISEGDPELELVMTNIMTREVVRHKVLLDQFPKRPDRMTRFLLQLTLQDKTTGILTVTDLGFGEFCPGTEQKMEFTIEI